MRITIAKKDFKKESKKEKNLEKEMHHSKNASTNAKNFIKRNNTYKLEEEIRGEKTNFTYLFYFLFIVFTAVFIAGVWKLFIVWNNSSFKTSAFSVYIESNPSYIVSLNSEEKSAAIISVKNDNLKSQILKQISLQIPIDAVIKVENVEARELFSIPMFLSYMTKMSGVSLENMTFFDYGKFILEFSGIDNEDKKELSLAVEEGVSSLSEDELFDVFKDPDIVSEGLSLEIINATETNGLAGSVSRILSPLGANIISLSSGIVQDKSSINANVQSKTTTKLSRLLKIPYIKKSPSSIADVTIIIGRDFVKKVR